MGWSNVTVNAVKKSARPNMGIVSVANSGFISIQGPHGSGPRGCAKGTTTRALSTYAVSQVGNQTPPAPSAPPAGSRSSKGMPRLVARLFGRSVLSAPLSTTPATDRTPAGPSKPRLTIGISSEYGTVSRGIASTLTEIGPGSGGKSSNKGCIVMSPPRRNQMEGSMATVVEISPPPVPAEAFARVSGPLGWQYAMAQSSRMPTILEDLSKRTMV